MNLISRVNHVLSILVNLSLAIRYGPALRSGPNLMVLVKGIPTYTRGLAWLRHSDTLMTKCISVDVSFGHAINNELWRAVNPSNILVFFFLIINSISDYLVDTKTHGVWNLGKGKIRVMS